MSAGVLLRQIDPPVVASVEFVFWRWLTNWHNHYGCPDCRKASADTRALARHLRREHPRWQPFIEAREVMLRPPPTPRAELWKDPDFRARQAAATRATLAKRWKDPDFRARNAAATRANWKDPDFRARQAAATRATLAKRWKDPDFRARQAAAVRDGTKLYWLNRRPV